MNFTTETPTKPGWYWMKQPGHEPVPVKINPDTHCAPPDATYAGPMIPPPGAVSCALVVRAVGDDIWLMLPLPDCTSGKFNDAPASLAVDVNGTRTEFVKRSWVQDGVLYVSGPGQPLFGRPPLHRAIAEWTRATFTTATPIDVARRAMEECQELIDELSTETATPRSVGMEVADVFHCLIDLCALYGIDFEAVCFEKLGINKDRQWAPPDESNQRRHIK